jgi:tape measure domain-containing protein
MADFNVEVIVDPTKAQRGSRQAIKALGSVEKQADSLRNTLRNTFAGLGAAAIIGEIVRLTDTYTNLQNRIRVVTNGTQQLTDVTQELFDIAQRTRSSFEGSAELYSRLALATKEMGVQTQELTQFTESMNKAIILSGASGREANAGLIQLSQGIASGALRGDELRSVLEQLPVVADVIAKQMNVTRGELRAMGAEGAITAEIILAAFKNARTELSERFLKTIPTISQSFQVLRNSLVKNIGAFNTSNGAAKLFAKTLILMANNMEFLLRSASALAIVLGTTLAANAIPKLITGIRALTAAMAANPFGLLLVVLSSVVAILITFGDKIELQEGKLAAFHDLAVVVWRNILEIVTKFVNYFKDNFEFIATIATEAFQKIDISLAEFILFAAKNIDKYIGFWIGAYDAILIVWNNFPEALNAIFRMALDGAISRVEKGLNSIIGLTNKIFEALGLNQQIAEIGIARLGESADKGVRDVGAALNKAFAEGFNFNFFEQGVTNLLDDAEKIAQARVTAMEGQIPSIEGEVKARGKLDQAFLDIITRLDQEIALLKLDTKEREIQTEVLRIEKKLKRELTDIENALVESRLREIQTLTTQVDLYEQIKGPVNEYKDSLEALNVLLSQGKINQDEFNAAMNATQLGGAIQDVKGDLLTGGFGELQELQSLLNERNLIIQQSREAGLINEQEYLNLSLKAQEDYNRAITDLEDARFAGQLRAGSATFEALANITEAFVGQQSDTYKALFAVSKAFALADTSIQIANALAKAANTPWPANIAAMASTATLTASLLSQIQSATFAGFENGGKFKVGGSGGPDSQLVQFRASPNETVSVKTPGQERNAQKDNSGGAGTPPEVKLTNVNVFDPSIVGDFLDSSDGDTAFVNSIKRNQGAIGQILINR